ncbi:MAG: PD-(D/E)XK nuclease family transposase [Treponema sp.]|nr:PD-(D/E)XK nuclease family transposase [Treponema sp.]
MMERTTLRPSPTALINPRCDPMFKAIFTQNTAESNFALKDFLSAILDREIRELALQPNEPPVDSLSEMQMSFDVSVVFDDGERADIELQGRNHDYDYAARAEIQAARILNIAAGKGGNWNAPKCYQISVLNFEYDKDDKSPLSWYTMRSKSSKALAGRLNVIFFDLVKIRKLRNTDADRLTKLEKWGMFFAYADDARHQDYIAQIARSEEGIMAADFIVKTMSADEANWWRQNSYWIAERDRNAERENAIKRGLAEGREKGLAEGRKRGLAEGRAEGEQRGAHSNAVETACRMLALNKNSLEEIASCTGLSLDEVKTLSPSTEA